MKLKQIAAASVMGAIVSTSAFADTTNFEGLSASLGLSNIGGSTKVTGVVEEASASAELGRSSQVGVLEVGYGFPAGKNFVIGTGVTFDLGKAKAGSMTAAIDEDEYSVAFRTKNHYSIYLQPTWVVNKSTGVYAKVGYNHTKGTMAGTFDEESFSGSAKFKGSSYGVGIKTFVNDKMFIQAEAQLVNFKSKTFTYDDGLSETYKPKMTRATVSVGYRF